MVQMTDVAQPGAPRRRGAEEGRRGTVLRRLPPDLQRTGAAAPPKLAASEAHRRRAEQEIGER